MKKTLLIAPLFALALCLCTCDAFFMGFDEKNHGPFDTDNTWSSKHEYITVNLDGEVIPGSGSGGRAMTFDIARPGFDYFEVAFYYNTTSIRSEWEKGQFASIYDVPRGIDYSRTTITPGYGAAIMFAGRKNDKTILALGKIVAVDDVPGAYIKSDSVSVIFELFPLTASVSYNPLTSSITTNFADTLQLPRAANTKIINAFMEVSDKESRRFPMYILPAGDANVKAEYRFVVDGAAWEDFGVIVAEVYVEGASRRGTAEKREARFPAGSSRYWYPIYNLDNSTEIVMENNQVKGVPAQNPIVFNIDTTNTANIDNEANGIFTLAFFIPVCALYDGNYRINDGNGIWYIRAAYQTYYYNMDNGADYSGGTVLMAVSSLREFKAPVIRLPI